MNSPKRIICVLGMHRSGTSCLTGSLQDAGLYLGDCHTWNPYNKKGNRENQEFVDLHDQILAANDGAWDHPPKNVVWQPQNEQRARELLDSYKAVPVLGFKDPRTLLVLDGWREIYADMQFIGIVRNPNAVASSLQYRSDMQRDDALSLWYRYNTLLYKYYKKIRFPVLCFDEDEAVFHQKLDTLISQMDLGEAAPEQRFYDSALKTSSGEQRLPWKIKWLYKKLLKVCL